MSAMDVDDLKALTERWLERSGYEVAASEDGGTFVVPTEEDEAVFISFDAIEDSAGESWPVMVFEVAVIIDIARGSVEHSSVLEFNDERLIGGVALQDDQLVLYDHCIGWPGNAELGVTIECLSSSVAAARAQLGEIKGSPPVPYSELVAD